MMNSGTKTYYWILVTDTWLRTNWANIAIITITQKIKLLLLIALLTEWVTQGLLHVHKHPHTNTYTRICSSTVIYSNRQLPVYLNCWMSLFCQFLFHHQKFLTSLNSQTILQSHVLIVKVIRFLRRRLALCTEAASKKLTNYKITMQLSTSSVL